MLRAGRGSGSSHCGVKKAQKRSRGGLLSSGTTRYTTITSIPRVLHGPDIPTSSTVQEISSSVRPSLTVVNVGPPRCRFWRTSGGYAVPACQEGCPRTGGGRIRPVRFTSERSRVRRGTRELWGEGALDEFWCPADASGRVDVCAVVPTNPPRSGARRASRSRRRRWRRVRRPCARRVRRAARRRAS